MDDLNNYRPVAIVPCIGKIFEKVLSLQFTNYLETNNILTSNQHGFRPNKSTTSAIVDLVSFITEGFERGDFVGITFCDLSKAFDCVDPQILLQIISKLNIDNSSTELFHSYLIDRYQVTSFNGEKSLSRRVQYGVPQGSILGPVLFLIYINNLPSFVDLKTILYADDTSLLTSAKHLDNVKSKLSTEQCRASKWFAGNGLFLNESKTNTMIFSTKNNIVNDNPEFVTFLGIKLDFKLSWEIHINEICHKLTKAVYILRKLNKIASLSVTKTVYFALFQNVYSYAMLAWGYSAHLDRIFRLQRKAIRAMLGLSFTADVGESFVGLQIMTVPALYVYQCLKYVKANDSLYNYHRNNCDYFTRNGDKIYIDYCRINKSRNSVNYYAPKFFNALPGEIASLPEPNFSHRIKKLLLQSPVHNLNDLNFLHK